MQIQDNNEINISVITNITLEPFFITSMNKQYSKNGLHPLIIYIPLEDFQNKSYINQISQSDLIIVWINLEILTPDIFYLLQINKISEQQLIENVIGLCNTVSRFLLTYSNAPIIWFGFEDYYTKIHIYVGKLFQSNGIVDLLNRTLVISIPDNIVCIDLKRVISYVGIINTYDFKNKYRWNAPYSSSLIQEAVFEIYKQYNVFNGISKKCLVLDADNVLWGGILSEIGIENVKLGSSGIGLAYQNFQKFVLDLYYHGVILSVCSKNNLKDVLTMFQNHSGMILKQEHISCFKVNWENKFENIKKIAQSLKLSLESLVFIDDSPFEITQIQSFLPDVTSILFNLKTIYENLSSFCLSFKYDQENIKKRHQTYQNDIKRASFASRYDNYDEFLKALEMTIIIENANIADYGRISELSQRTNKCTNGTRYTISELKYLDSNYYLYKISVSDKFGDLGLVGAIGVYYDNLELFCLSCRALGRHIEEIMIKHILENHTIKKYNFIVTENNKDLNNLFKNLINYSN